MDTDLGRGRHIDNAIYAKFASCPHQRTFVGVGGRKSVISRVV
jgi:hypothetical protein